VLRDEIGHVSAAEASKMVGEIHVSAERLYRTLRNYLRILDVLNDKQPSGVLVERTRSTEVPVIVKTTAESVTARYGRQDNLVLDCSSLDVPLASSDLATIVSELVDNACKYSVRGTLVAVKLQTTPEGIKFEVSDRGRGMDPEQIAQIGAFRQFDRKKYEQQGLGLGLTLTQHLVERHGGKFVLKSTPGSGTTVTASWPGTIL